jgi:hypothetical protein
MTKSRTIVKVSGSVKITGLKQFAIDHLTPASSLRQLLVEESNELAATEFMIKAQVWLRLISKETEASRSGEKG